MAERKQNRPVIPCLWTNPEEGTLKVENDCFDTSEGQCVVVIAEDLGESVAVGITPLQAREMASALIVYAFFVDRENAALGEADHD